MKNAEIGYPTVVDPQGCEHTVYGWGIHIKLIQVTATSGQISGTGWEWYALEPIEDDVAYGFVHGVVDEFGSFSISELKENGVHWIEDPAKLRTVAPPVGWKKKELLVK